MYAARRDRKSHTADGSTYTFEAIATLLGFGACHVAKMVVLALNVGVLLMMEGWISFGQQIRESGIATSNLPRLPNCVIGIDIFATCLDEQILERFEDTQSSDVGHGRRSADKKRRGQEQNSVVGKLGAWRFWEAN